MAKGQAEMLNEVITQDDKKRYLIDEKSIEEAQNLIVLEDKDYTYKSSYRFQTMPPEKIGTHPNSVRLLHK